jgi:uncharacterized membrane protein YfcA
VGSGSLITFPVLLAFGYPPVVASTSNTVGVTPGYASAALGYRKELVGQRDRIIRFALGAFLGGATGALLLLVLPAAAFKAIVPVLIVLALVLVLWGSRINKMLMARRGPGPHKPGIGTSLAMYGCAVYGGYFGAAQGVLLMGVLGLTVDDTMQRLNGLKNTLTLSASLVAAIIYIASGHIDWIAALLVAAGSIVGGQLGAYYGRKLSPQAMRAIIVVVGIGALIRLFFP